MTHGNISTSDDLVQAAPGIVRLARLGFASKGLVYIAVGALAIRAAIDGHGRTAGSHGALVSMLRQPFGRFILTGIAAGLFGYALWRVIVAVRDPRRRGSSVKGLSIRVASAGKALAYGALGVEAAKLALDGARSHGAGENQPSHWASMVIHQPFGRALVAIVGLAVIGYGLYQCFNAWRAKLSRQLALGRIPPATRTWVIRVSRFGIGARGVVFVLIGYFLLRAGLDRKASEARGVAGVLRSFYEQPFGHYILMIIAVGLVSYGVYEVIQSRYRRIEVV